MTNQRGVTNESLMIAAKKLKEPLSAQAGNWKLLSESQFSDDVVQMLQCPAHVSRAYINQQTGDVVTLMVIVGPPGPISVHKPEICYGSQAFKALGDRERVNVADRQRQSHDLWRVSMESLNSLKGSQSVFYGWSTGTGWSASKEPRFAHANEPYLYKIQLAGPLTPATDAFNPCEDFLNWFLPDIQKHLVSTHPETPAELSSPK